MAKQSRGDQYGKDEAVERLQKIMRGAFSGPPTPLKDIPKKSGESRASQKADHKKARRRSSRATSKT